MKRVIKIHSSSNREKKDAVASTGLQLRMKIDPQEREESVHVAI